MVIVEFSSGVLSKFSHFPVNFKIKNLHDFELSVFHHKINQNYGHVLSSSESSTDQDYKAPTDQTNPFMKANEEAETSRPRRSSSIVQFLLD